MSTTSGYVHVDPSRIEALGPEWVQFYTEIGDGPATFDHAAYRVWQVGRAVRLEWVFNVMGWDYDTEAERDNA